jgi:predicted DNA-binding protein with PD1-like motif
MQNLPVTGARRFMGRLDMGADLLEALEEQCRVHSISLGEVRALGAVTKARVGFYHQKEREYHFLDFDQPLEIVSLTGNISLKDGRPLVHAHVTLADAAGRALGGHLAPGTEVFACEFVIQEYEAREALSRGFDEETGLFLWPKS